MGCRTSNGKDINGFGQLKDGRGNICPVTIIMPTLAMQAKEEVDKEALFIKGSSTFISSSLSGSENTGAVLL